MRVLAVLAAWGVLALLSTLCFALGAAIGYRRGVTDTLADVRRRRRAEAGCRPLPLLHSARRASSRLARPGARLRRTRWHPGRPAPDGPHAGAGVLVDRRAAVAIAAVVAFVAVGVPVTAVGATTAQPGEGLWRLKLGLEQARVALARSPHDDAVAHLSVASNRLSELGGMVGRDIRPDLVADVSAHLETHATAVVERLDDIDDTADRVDVEVRLDGVVGEQVATVATIVADGCAQRDGSCEALERTLDRSVALQQRASTPPVIAAEVPDDAAPDDAAGQPADAVAPDDSSADAVDDSTVDPDGADPATGAATSSPSDSSSNTPVDATATEQPGSVGAQPPAATADATPAPTTSAPPASVGSSTPPQATGGEQAPDEAAEPPPTNGSTGTNSGGAMKKAPQSSNAGGAAADATPSSAASAEPPGS